MHTPTFSQTTKRDWENVKDACREFYGEFKDDPVAKFGALIVAMLVALLILLPWLTFADDFAR